MNNLNGMGYSMYGSIWGFLLNILVILIIVGAVVVLLNRSGYAGPGDNERLVRIEKDVEDIKKTVEDIKNKLEEI